MPFSRGRKQATSKLPHLRGKGPAMENALHKQEEGTQVKRSPSSPQGAPKKRSAFVDITNASKGLPTQNKKKKNEANLKKMSVANNGKKQALCSHIYSMEQLIVILTSRSGSITPEEKPEKPQEKKAIEKEAVKPQVEEQCSQIPEEFDIDKDHLQDSFMTAEYAKDIFDYLKAREEKFILQNYMDKQPDLNREMRSILVDWMVEVQENFELNHETLYLAVKLADHYLSHTVSARETLQLIGSTTMLIASKFEERCPPCVDDFLYICDDAYKREELIAMEMDVLQTLKFDINIPVAYRFLRRYAKCVQADMETLTLARYICELTLQELEFVPERASQLASACLLLALHMKDLGGWTPILQYHTGYTLADLVPLVKRLNFLLTYPTDDKLKSVRSKYSHKVFFEVAKIKTLDMMQLHEALC
uniref:Cyclin B3 n=1 Tax=Lepisosteus oculatus TaxID=7918 RepID=W5NAH2_LEPOC